MNSSWFQNITQHFNRIAPDYDRHAVLQKMIGDELCQRLDLVQLKVQNVLDVGCGTGVQISSLTDRFPKAHLSVLDNSEQMLIQARKKISWKQRLFKQVSQSCKNALHTAYTDAQFDVVFANLLLPYLSEPGEFFHEVQRITQSAGVFCFTTFGPDTLQELQEILAEIPAEISAGLHFGQLVDMHILGDSLVAAGFREPVLDVERYTLSFTHFDELWQELLYSGVLMGTPSAELHKKVKAEYEGFRNQSAERGLTVTFEVVYAQTWASDSEQVSRNRAKLPGEYSFPLSELGRR